MLVWLSVSSEMQTCVWLSWCHCHSLSLASVKSRLVPFWYRLTRVVPDKGPLNGCVCVCPFVDEVSQCKSSGHLSPVEGLNTVSAQFLWCDWCLCFRFTALQKNVEKEKEWPSTLWTNREKWCPFSVSRQIWRIGSHTKHQIDACALCGLGGVVCFGLDFWLRHYICIVCLFMSYVSPLFLFFFIFPYLLPYLSFPLRKDLFRLLARCRKMRLNLALVFFVYSML